jgi:membrane protein YqaA with SNARE-associated domain
MALRLAAFLWGLAEATLFFIVPDVLLSAAALNRLRTALIACAWATAGALIGGTLLFAWGAHDPAGAWAVLDRIPAIHAAMPSSVRDALNEHGLAALFLGPLTGTPYKLYAVAAGQTGFSLPDFLLVSIPARAVRFILLCLLVHLIARKLPTHARLPVLAACWLAFYSAYFLHMGW